MREVKPTQKPVPSSDIKDLFFNSGLLDIWTTSLEPKYIDRFGNCHLTAAGMEWIFNELVEKFKVDMNIAIITAGYITVDSFQQGADLPNNELTQRNQILRDEATGEYYRWDGYLPKQVPTGSTPQSTGGIGKGAWVSVGDASLRGDLSSKDGASIVKTKDGANAQEHLNRISVKWIGGLNFESAHGLSSLVSSFYENGNIGGGIFVYDENIPRSKHNGITTISPEVKFTNITEWLNIDNGRQGKGCWVKQIQGNTITSDEGGCIPDGDSPVDIPYFESLRDIEMMKGYQVGKDVGTDNQPMLQAMLNLGVTNITITKGNYRIKNPLEYMENTIIYAHGAHVFASKDFGKALPKESRILLKSKLTEKVFINHARVNGGRWDGCYRYYTYHENALSRSIAAGFTKDKADPVTNKMWSIFECYNMTDFELHNVNSAFGRYLNDDAYSINSYCFKCKSYYMEDDCYTSTSGGDITVENRRTYGQQITYDTCEAWFAGFGSGAGSSGFEIDDGVDKTLYINCKTFFCPRGFNQHVHPYSEHANTPARNNYMHTNCSVYSSYIDLDYSPVSSVAGHGAFTIVGGDLNGVNGVTYIGCYAEDNMFNDFFFNQAQTATKAPLNGIKIIGFNSKLTQNLDDLASSLVSSGDFAGINFTMSELSVAAGLATGLSVSNSSFDGGGFKQALFFRGGSDVVIDSSNTFSHFATIGRIVMPSVESNHKSVFKLSATFIDFIKRKWRFNPNILRVENGDIFDATGITIDASNVSENAHTIINCSSSMLRVNDINLIGNGILGGITRSSKTNSIMHSGYFENLSRINIGGVYPTVGSASDNISINAPW
ncbi:hypothetical protein [Moellerella wisconsensis]|uniref:tail fiber/spike domain-containing protein n=1 Tax=Moellerella wisconsensis TaxID=158849 RepID=UPI00240F4DBA|nr:hypothetical protein [Moellerella wisconsensis]